MLGITYLIVQKIICSFFCVLIDLKIGGFWNVGSVFFFGLFKKLG
jgi:hypothetical protein